MAAIHAASFPPGEIWNEAIMAAQLGMPGVAGFLHESGGLVLLRVAADEAEILTIAVVPAARRGGIGRALLMRAAAHARGAGAVRLLLEVSETNTPAHTLYRTLGFTDVGRRPRYYPDQSDALLMELALAG